MADSLSVADSAATSMKDVVLPNYKLYLVLEGAKGDSYYDFKERVVGNQNAGFDLVAAETFKGGWGDAAHLLDLGVRAMMVRKDTNEPVHYWLLPRSSVFKTGHMMANSVGVIDSSYRGVLKAPVVCVTKEGAGFRKGERYFQILAPDMGWIQDVEIVAELPATERGDGGFGSTGR